jgi:hypothetical protein
VFALRRRDANDLSTAAQKMGKAKDAAKPKQDAPKAIGAAVNGYGAAIDEGVDESKKAQETGRLALVEADADKELP